MCDHVVLRDHLVRLVPTKSDLDDRAPIDLTSRDWEILTAVDLHGYLTLEVIDLVFFPSSRPDHRPSTRAYHRLHQLWLWGYVERIELPVARVIGGRRPFLYALSPRGLRLLDGRASSHDASSHCRRLDRTSELIVEHSLAVAAVWANVLALIRPRPITLGAWIADRDLRARQLRVRDCVGGRWLPFLPDAYFELHYASGRVQCCLLEVDLGNARAEGDAPQALRVRPVSCGMSLYLDLEPQRLRGPRRRTLGTAPPERRDRGAKLSRAAPLGRIPGGDALRRLRFVKAEWRCLDGSTYGLLFAGSAEGTSGSWSHVTR
jgi:hypothetical protein